MRILIYAHSFAPMVGGIETYTMLLARGLARGQGSASRTEEVTVVTQAAAKGMDDSILPFRIVRRPGLFQLTHLIRAADVVHIANPAFLPLLLGWILRKPIAVEHDGYQSVCPNGLLFHEPTKSDCAGHFMERRYAECYRCNRKSLGEWRSLRALWLTFPRRWLCRRVALNIGPTRHMADRIQLPGARIIYHGIDAAPDEPRARKNLAVCFAYVGRFVQEKGVPVLLQAAHRLADRGFQFQLKLIGDGPLRADLEQLTSDLGLKDRTEFTGFLRGAELQDALTGTTAAIMPSIWEDCAPLACIEHLMNGRLLIASDLGGLGELVDGMGLKFTANDPEALATCLQQVIERPELAREVGAKARERAKTMFTEERMVREHLEAYARIANPKRGLEKSAAMN